MKKILKIIGCLIIGFITIILYISYITDYNNETLSNLTKEISKNYNTTEEITYSNQYGNYYIIKTPSKVIVLSKDYKEITKEELSKIKELPNKAELVYKTNKLMYEKTIKKNKKLIYEYYDALSGEKIKTTKLELQ